MSGLIVGGFVGAPLLDCEVLGLFTEQVEDVFERLVCDAADLDSSADHVSIISRVVWEVNVQCFVSGSVSGSGDGPGQAAA